MDAWAKPGLRHSRNFRPCITLDSKACVLNGSNVTPKRMKLVLREQNLLNNFFDINQRYVYNTWIYSISVMVKFYGGYLGIKMSKKPPKGKIMKKKKMEKRSSWAVVLSVGYTLELLKEF